MEIIFPLFQKPGRYIDHEINAFRKDWDSAKLRVLLAYPDAYEIGMSSYGYMLIYSSTNASPELLCDRAFLPWSDMLEHMLEKDIPIWGLETKRPAAAFDIIAFSLHYELCYTNILWFLKASRIPIFSEDRNDKDPIVVAGGPCTSNPAPLEPFIDAFFIGEWDTGIREVLERLSHAGSRRERLEILAETPGVYVPALNEGARKRSEPPGPHPAPVVPLIEVPHNRITVEIARGCGRGCRFCHAGFIYRPVRERDVGEVLQIVAEAIRKTGFEEVSLLSLSATDYSRIEELMEGLAEMAERSIFSIALPSFRAGTLTDRMIEIIKGIKKTGFTIAPEAGTQRLRDVINKQLTEEEVFETVERAVKAGWQTVKLYFMVGLPTETQEDVEAIGDMVSGLLKETRRLPRKPRFNITISPFVPKPHTPFQWEAQEPLEMIRQKIGYLKERFSKSRAKIKEHNPHQSLVEAILSRGDRSTWKLIYEAFSLGARFDQWGELFSYLIWERAMEKCGIEPKSRRYATEEPLPWDCIDVGVEKGYLLRERELALKGRPSPSCIPGCKRCGVCSSTPIRFAEEKPQEIPDTPVFKRERRFSAILLLEKRGIMRLIGQNDLQNILHRAFRRAGIPLAYSQGHSPHPGISFAEASPLGMELIAEPLKVDLWREVKHEELLRINRFLPEGLRLIGVVATGDSLPSLGKLKVERRYTAFISREELSPSWRDHLPPGCKVVETPQKVIVMMEGQQKPYRAIEGMLRDPDRARAVRMVKRSVIRL